MNEKIKIAIATVGDPSSYETWSGIPFSMMTALQRRGHTVTPIALSRATEPWYYAWLRRYHHRVKGKWFLAAVEKEWLRRIAMELDRAVESVKPDVVLVYQGDWLAYTSFTEPSCIIHDATFASLLNYYPSFSNLTQRSIRMGHNMYQAALDRSSAAIFCSDWAAESAIRDYNTPSSKVHTIPFGANLVAVPSFQEVEQWIAQRQQRSRCNLLFIGTQWERKGGPDALLFLDALRNAGVQATLTIVGCTPEIPPSMRDFVRLEGYLNKQSYANRKRLEHIYRDAHALIVPSLAECYGCVYCEANAFGIPALGRETGGVAQIIREGINGLLLKEGERVEHFAQRWLLIWNDAEAYQGICRNARAEYDCRLNYDVFADRLEEVVGVTMERKLVEVW